MNILRICSETFLNSQEKIKQNMAYTILNGGRIQRTRHIIKKDRKVTGLKKAPGVKKINLTVYFVYKQEREVKDTTFRP